MKEKKSRELTVLSPPFSPYIGHEAHGQLLTILSSIHIEKSPSQPLFGAHCMTRPNNGCAEGDYIEQYT